MFRFNQDNKTQLTTTRSPFTHGWKACLWLAAFIFPFLIGLSVMASNGWLPTTDAMTGKRTGWFGQEIARNAPSSWNLLAAPLPSPATQLSKEYIYAGSRLLAVEDANAGAATPSPTPPPTPSPSPTPVLTPADIAVWRPSTGMWYVMDPSPRTDGIVFNWGQQGDIPVPADFDGDGKTDFSIYRPTTGEWWIYPSAGGDKYVVPFGAACEPPKECDFATPADFDGDGMMDIAVWRPRDGVWYVVQSSNQEIIYTQWGKDGDIPVPANFDGDARADYAVWRPSKARFYSLDSSTGEERVVEMGEQDDRPFPADYDGDGKADHALFRDGIWYIRRSSNGETTQTEHGSTEDVLVSNDYDGDGKVDIASWRESENGRWEILQTLTGERRIEYWGMVGDIPVPAYYRR